MRIELLSEGAAECPLIRLFDFVPSEVDRLQDACLALASGEHTSFDLHTQCYLEPVADCRFVFRRSTIDKGVAHPSQGETLVMALTDAGWREVAEKLQPFRDDSGGFNWLTNEGDVHVLISSDGLW